MTTFLDHGIELRSNQSTGNVKVKCPKCHHTHSPGNRSATDLSVNVSEGVWNCHRCGWTGTLGTAIWQSQIKQYKPPRPIERMETSLTERTHNWFARRGIPKEVVERRQIVAQIENGKSVILFPHFRNGIHVNTQRRYTKVKDFRQEPDAELIFYGLDDITDDMDTLIICEGQMDALSFEVAGYLNVLSIPSGVPWDKKTNTVPMTAKLEYLESAADLLSRMTKVYLACDSDDQGKAMNNELARRIGREKCFIVEWPDGIKDANDALMAVGGPAWIQESIDRARPFPIEGLWQPHTLRERVDALYDFGYDPGTRIGFKYIDEAYRPRTGLVSVVTGWSSHGKSTWLDHMIVNLALNHQWKVAIYSPENQPLHYHESRLIEIHRHKPFDIGIGGRMSRPEMEESRAFIEEHFMFILPERPTIDNILRLGKTALLQMGINGLIIDPWNEIEHQRPPGLTETEYISQALTQIRDFARNTNVHVWVLAHPAKPNQWNPISQAPELSHISQSNNWWNKCDYGLSIWRKPGDNSVWSQMHVKKVRHKETGQVGIVDFRVNYANRMVETRPHEDEP